MNTIALKLNRVWQQPF